MTRARHALAAAAAAAAAAPAALILLLAGCTGPGSTPASGPTPAAEPSASSAAPAETPSPSPSPTPSVEPPERPVALDDDGVEGAKAAAEYFVALDSYIMATNDTAAYEQLSHPLCETCANRLDQAREIAEGAYEFTGGEGTTRILEVYQQDESTRIWPIDVEVTVDEVTITDSEGTVQFSEDVTVDQQRFEVVMGGQGWKIVAVVDLDEVDA
ncbi:DUF6318 family protein [Isoptericola jiangsuensis]|uniref:DUF6318 family protein n=1 Tax=Isoptericola jiangsuensis TaxID=548579 RepID=UPI003AACB30B